MKSAPLSKEETEEMNKEITKWAKQHPFQVVGIVLGMIAMPFVLLFAFPELLTILGFWLGIQILIKIADAL
jgi:hypothetical protein